jgi:hypothetical protein
MNKAFKSILIGFILISIIGTHSYAQLSTNNQTVSQTIKDSIQPDTAQSIVLKRAHSPRTAWYLSAVVPGAGQVFNHKLWKVPIIYGGFAYGFYVYYTLNNYYNTYYNPYHKYAHHYTDNYLSIPDTNFNIKGITLSLAQVQEQKNYYRKNRDLSIILLSAWYVLNVVDACVDAYFFDYNMSDKLSVNIKPLFNCSNRQDYYTGLTFCFHTK